MLKLFKNPGFFCAQACMKSILYHYYPGKSFSFQKLAKMSYKRRNGGTESTGILLAFDALGLKVKGYTEKIELRERDKDRQTKEFYRKYGIAKNIQLKMIKEAKRRKLLVKKKLKISDLKRFLEKDCKIIVLLNWNIVKNKKKFQGHYVVINNIGKNTASVINVGPKKPSSDKHISLRKFEKAWHSNGTDSDTIVVCGMK